MSMTTTQDRQTLVPPSYDARVEEQALATQSDRPTIPVPTWWPSATELDIEAMFEEGWS